MALGTRFFPLAGTGGSTFNETVAETVSAVEDLTGLLVPAAGDMAESAAAAETLTGLLVPAVGAIAETAAAADTVTGLETISAAIAETAAAAETLTELLTAVGAIAESGAAAETITGLMDAVGAVAETAAAAETLSGLLTMAAAIAEVATALEATDGTLGNQTYDETVEETAAANDAVDADVPSAAVPGGGGGIPFFRRLTRAEEEALDGVGSDLVGQVVANIQAQGQTVNRKRVKAAFRAMEMPMIPPSAVITLAVELGRQMAAENEEEEEAAMLLLAA